MPSVPRPRLLTIAIFTAAAIVTAVGRLPMTGGAADVDAGRRKAEACAACHGPDGNAVTPGTPSLAAMPAFYTHWQLIMFRDGRRSDPQMTPFVQHLTDADLGDLAAFYAAQAARGRPAEIDAAKAAVGRMVAQTQHCTSCHGPGLMGQNQIPRLAGQDFDYLLKRLRGYKAKTTSDLDGMMTMVSQALSEEDIDSLVHFMASVTPAAGAATGGQDR